MDYYMWLDRVTNHIPTPWVVDSLKNKHTENRFSLHVAGPGDTPHPHTLGGGQSEEQTFKEQHVAGQGDIWCTV